MGILAELLAEVEDVKGLRARLQDLKKEADYWYDRACYSRIKAKAWKKLAKDQRKVHAYRLCAVKDSRELARKDRSFAENRNEVLSTELDEARKLIDILRTQCKHDYEDIQELREQRNLAEQCNTRDWDTCKTLTLEVNRLFTENYELREKLRCTE